MNDVKDLNHTANPEVTMSDFTGNEEKKTDTTIRINAVGGGITGIENQTAPNPIRINPSKLKGRRTIEPDQKDTGEVNPENFMPKKQAPQAKPANFQETAMSQLDAMVKRKNEEFQAFVRQATAEDEENRERIENGLDEAPQNTDEVNYLPDSVEHNGKAGKLVVSTGMAGEEIDDFEEEETDTKGVDAPDPVRHTTVEDPFSVSSEPSQVSMKEEVVEEAPVQKPVPVVEAAPAPKTVDQQIKEDVTVGIFDDNAHVVSMDALTERTSSDFDIAEEDFEDVTYEAGENPEELSDDEIARIGEEAEKHLRNEILEKIVHAGRKLDVGSFVVSTKVISIKDAIKNAPAAPDQRVGRWPLMYAERPYESTPLKGPEIALLAENDDSNSDNGVGLNIQQAKIMYEHDANPYKPITLEGWAKTIPFADVDNIFAAMYQASLKGANYIPMACPATKCQYAYLTDDVSFKDMIHFPSDETKAKYEEIMAMKITAEDTTKYNSVISVINDQFAVGIKLPSIYTVLYEYGSLNAAFMQKYASIISIIQYIDYIYRINPDTQQFEPIGWKPYPGDYGKTFKSKISAYAKVLKELDDAEFSVLIALVNSMINKATTLKGITYTIPAAKCPKCGTEIPERNISPRGMVFMRQRLVELATTPTLR